MSAYRVVQTRYQRSGGCFSTASGTDQRICLSFLQFETHMRYDELVSITGLPEGTVKSHLFRARKMLRENLLMNYQKEAL